MALACINKKIRFLFGFKLEKISHIKTETATDGHFFVSKFNDLSFFFIFIYQSLFEGFLILLTIVKLNNDRALNLTLERL